MAKRRCNLLDFGGRDAEALEVASPLAHDAPDVPAVRGLGAGSAVSVARTRQHVVERTQAPTGKSRLPCKAVVAQVVVVIADQNIGQ